MCVASVYDLILRPPLVVYPGGLTSSLDFNRTTTTTTPTTTTTTTRARA